MKWQSHRERTKAIAEDLNLPMGRMLEGCVYPDQVSMNKSVLLVLGYKLTEIKIRTAKIAPLASLFRILGGFLVAFLLIKLIP